ncbi:aminoglycoside phosphotransferase family protein [Armatimonas sp.]|uniref:aminoglycoside phosphotransferase family protein n=1 Tax=Armatimonas sp. TaxID=1872638 RepID=UPI00374CE447
MLTSELKARLECVLGQRIVNITRRIGGYSLALRLRLELADGRLVFAKVATTEPTARWLRREVVVYEALGSQKFLAEFLGWADDSTEPFLLLEDLSEAHWPPPWTTARVDVVLTALSEVRRAPLPPQTPALEAERAVLTRWASIADDPAPFLSLGLCSAGWLENALPTLLAAEQTLNLDGTDFLHLDVRSDNLCFIGERAVIVDWNWSSVGNGEADIACWLPSLHSEGGPLPETILPAATPWAAALAGFFGSMAGLPPPEGAPTVRTVQRTQLESALPWVVRALGLPPIEFPPIKIGV